MNCPHCQRLLYSRRHKTCGYCHGELPAEILFTAEELAIQDAEKQAMAEERAARKLEDEEERKQLQQQAAASAFMGTTMLQ